MNIRIGSAPVSWGVWFANDLKQTPAMRFLNEIAEAGYTWIELGPYGYLSTNINDLKRAIDDRGLKVCGTFALEFLHHRKYWPNLDRQVQGACELLAALEGSYLILIDGIYTDEVINNPKVTPTINDDQWKTLIEKSHAVGRFTHDKYGIRTVFHPHTETHVENEDQIERFIADTDPDLLGLCLDTGHQAYCGCNPLGLYRRHHHRIEYFHLKNISTAKREQFQRDGTTFGAAVGKGMFTELSDGEVDFVALRDAWDEFSFEGFAIVEQDMYPCPFDQPLPIAKRNLAYLRQLGLT